MRTPIMLSLSDETVLNLRSKASELQVPYSSLAELCIRGSLKKFPEEELKKWAELHRKVKSGPKLRPSEVLALTTLTPEWRPFNELVSPISSRKVFWRALSGLNALRLAECDPGNALIASNGTLPFSRWRLAPKNT